MPSKDPTASPSSWAAAPGTRLWPASRRARPKQLLSLGAPESLIGAAVRRGRALVGLENTLIVTAADQAAAVRAAIPDLPAANIVAEPVPRNTAAAVGLGAVDGAAARRPGRRHRRAARRSLHRRRGDVRAAGAPGDRRGARDHRHHRRDARRTPRPASATSASGARLPRAGADAVHDVGGFFEKPDRADRRALRRLGRVPVELGDVLPHRRAACWTKRARHLPGAGRAARRGGRAPAIADAGHRGGLRRRAVDLDRPRHHGEGDAACASSPARSAGTTSAAGRRCPRCARPTRAATSCIGGATLIDGDGNIVVADEGAPLRRRAGRARSGRRRHAGRRAGHPEGPCAGCAPHRRGREAVRPRRSAVTR